ncbi:MAG: branched-chain amino acid ABC transporter permease [Chloroflexota bacterium]|nr:branched-chain amino acid ABC transporter permease [Chloroflexota bacterium]
MIAVVLALGLPLVVYPALALDIVLWSLFAVAVNLLLGFGGLLSFGHAAFWGTGGYTAGILAKMFALAYPLAVAGGTVAAALLAMPIGYLSVRRRGIYFAMVTLAFSQMVFYVVNEWRAVTGGENGLQSIPRTLPGVPLAQPLAFYYAALPLALCGFWLAHRAVHSPFGHVLVAIRDNEARAQALGYPTHRYKVVAFVLTAALSGLAGSLYSLGHGFAALELVDWRTSGIVVMMVILGGIGTFWGSAVGAALVLLLRDWLSTWTDAWGVVTGVIFVLVVLSFRRGIWGTLVRASAARRRRPSSASVRGTDVLASQDL